MLLVITTVINIIVFILFFILFFKFSRIKNEIDTSSKQFQKELQIIFDDIIIRVIQTNAKVNDERQKSIEIISKVIDKVNKLASQLTQIKYTYENVNNSIIEFNNSINKEIKKLQSVNNIGKDNINSIKFKIIELSKIIKQIKN